MDSFHSEMNTFHSEDFRGLLFGSEKFIFFIPPIQEKMCLLDGV